MYSVNMNEFLRTFRDFDQRIEELEDAIAFEVAHRVYEETIQFARGGLSKDTAAKYLEALQPPEKTPDGVIVAISDETEWKEFPKKIERGMKPGFMAKPGDKPRVIPFTHENAPGKPTGYLPDFLPSRMPIGLMSRKSRREAGSKIHTHSLAKWAQRRRRYPLQLQHHKTDIRKNMRNYETFRTIPSDDPNAWYHPGITPRRFLRRAQALVRKETSRIIKSYLDVWD